MKATGSVATLTRSALSDGHGLYPHQDEVIAKAAALAEPVPVG